MSYKIRCSDEANPQSGGLCPLGRMGLQILLGSLLMVVSATIVADAFNPRLWATSIQLRRIIDLVIQIHSFFEVPHFYSVVLVSFIVIIVTVFTPFFISGAVPIAPAAMLPMHHPPASFST